MSLRSLQWGAQVREEPPCMAAGYSPAVWGKGGGRRRETGERRREGAASEGWIR